jgi:hypothetical protein
MSSSSLYPSKPHKREFDVAGSTAHSWGLDSSAVAASLCGATQQLDQVRRARLGEGPSRESLLLPDSSRSLPEMCLRAAALVLVPWPDCALSKVQSVLDSYN